MSSFGQTFFISLFSEQIRQDFGLTDGAWGGVYGLGTLLSAGVMVWLGTLADRYSAQRLGSAILLCLAATCLAMSFASQVWMLVICIFFLRLFGQGMASHIAVVSMSRWFVATRGRALAICTLGFTFGEAILPLLVVSLLSIVLWQQIWIVAALASCIGALILWRLLTTERAHTKEDSATAQTGMMNQHWSRADAVKHPVFWLMVPAILGPSAFNTAFFFQQTVYADLKGWSHLELVSLFPAYTLLSVFSMIASGWALDRFGTAKLLGFYQIPMISAFLFFAFGQSSAAIFAGLIFLAITTGANATLPNAFWAQAYGTKHIGAIKALAAAVMVLGSAMGPFLTGTLMDAGVPLDMQYIGVSVFFGFVTASLLSVVRLYSASAHA